VEFLRIVCLCHVATISFGLCLFFGISILLDVIGGGTHNGTGGFGPARKPANRVRAEIKSTKAREHGILKTDCVSG
jgi:hypothetical protein